METCRSDLYLPVEVEGHTDNIPPSTGCGFPSNWELSAARSASVVRFLIKQGLDPNIFTAVGYADTRPLAPNTSALGRSMNRRIEINLITGTDKEAYLKEQKAKEGAEKLEQ